MARMPRLWQPLAVVCAGRAPRDGGIFVRAAISLVVAATVLAGCTGDPADRGLGPSCAAGLDAANHNLTAAKAAGLADSVNWGKAASLISAAKVQQQFSEYQNCVVKTKEARRLLGEIPRR
jgi:hypothetical protein